MILIILNIFYQVLNTFKRMKMKKDINKVFIKKQKTKEIIVQIKFYLT